MNTDDDDQLANYVGGTEGDPCPTGIGFLGSLYCNDNDYRSWHLAAKNLYTQGILPSWLQYVAAVQSATDTGSAEYAALFAAVELYRTEFAKLPASTLWKVGTSNYVAEAIALMQQGQVTLANVRKETAALGVSPLDLPSGPHVTVPSRSAIPWWGWGLIALATGGVGLYVGSMGAKK